MIRAIRRLWGAVVRLLRDPAGRLRLGAAVASGILLALAFPAIDLSPLALVALVPLLWAWRGATPGRAALYGFVFGCVFFSIVLYWLWYFGLIAIVPLVAGCAAYTAVTGALVGYLTRAGFSSPWLIGAAWVLPETLRGRWPFGGLPWGDLGITLHDFPPARALASWGGVALVSFLIVVFNAYLVEVVVAARAHASRALAFAAVGAVGVMVIVAVADVARFEPRRTGELRVAMLQGNDQNRELTQAEKSRGLLTGKHLALASRLRGPYDLIVFPESSLDQFNPESNRALRNQLVAVGAAHGADVLANAAVPAPDGRDFNTNLVYTPDGRLVGSYAKQHLVPFGEYVPHRSLIDWTGVVDRIPNDYSPGEKRTIFRVKGHRLATVICFESAFGPLVRDFVRDGAEVVVVSTNNRSYRRSGNSAQHIAHTQMRAAETARPFLQASISGITAAIDADGDVHDKTHLFRNTVVTETVATATGETPYVRFGDWVAAASAALLLGAALAARLRRRPAAFPRLAKAEGKTKEPVGRMS
ncbi:MAG TPA: apolipoprotein N-acyltransferase [Acidimicrobiia bacterium]